ncbi:MFS transporter [Actinocatenispora rupis]|uniref:MFS transporter n=1 Tax=Actinocatenispora rupis TaxID=519421 RepID=A0A8J3J415_9ACTN|nr:MFS transporter [Actinocatenispora rupis]GID09747.1 MFS transporter [Actinocatenispora rupis]
MTAVLNLPTTPTAVRRWAALPVILTAAFMVTLDFFIVAVAVPSMQRDLSATTGDSQLVLAGYGLALASALILGGRLGDLYGQKRMFLLGLALFTAASAGCGLAPGAGWLIAARVGQGLAAALLTPQGLAILRRTYEGADRVRALTAYALTLGLAAVGGQLVGGLLIDADVAGLGWRACFLVNVPVGLVTLALAPRLVPGGRRTGGQLDLPGAALVTLALLAVVLPLVEGREHGWPAWTWLSLAAAVPLGAGFVAYQRRVAARGGGPLVHPALFRHRTFGVGLVATVAFQAGMGSFFFVLALYLQAGHGMGPLGSGVAFTPIALGYVGSSLLAGRVAARLGRQALALGGGTMALGLTLVYLTVPAGSVAALVPGFAVTGVGMGLVLAPLTTLVLARVPVEYAGAAAGALNTAQQVGGALGIAVIGVLFYGRLTAGYAVAFRAGLVYLVLAALAVAVLAQALPKPRR